MGSLIGILHSSWKILLDASPFILFGLFIAALTRAFISGDMIVQYIGGRDLRSVFSAALFGVPLPLCSCGVVPTAMALRKQGASRPAVLSFLISTPESSIDSIAITWALIDPLMTVFRPIAAFLTGFVAGIADILFGKKGDDAQSAPKHCAHCADDHGAELAHPISQRMWGGMRFAFSELLVDMSRWFLVGILIAGAITYAIPEHFIESSFGQGWQSMFIMLAIGLPLYVCATASTPIAAALILKGMSPGAALVFLLTGPATNAASFTVIVKMLGARSALIYILSIAICAILLGMGLNQLYDLLGIDIRATMSHAHEMIPVWAKWATALPLTAAMLWAAARKRSG